MPKEIRGDPRRQPPETAADHQVIEDGFATLMPNLQPLVRAVDEAIRAAILGLDYAVKFKRAFYGLPAQGWIIELAPYSVSANVLFLGGADFESPPALGTTGRTRYVKVATLAEVNQPDLIRWFEQAALTPGWR